MGSENYKAVKAFRSNNICMQFIANVILQVKDQTELKTAMNDEGNNKFNPEEWSGYCHQKLELCFNNETRD